MRPREWGKQSAYLYNSPLHTPNKMDVSSFVLRVPYYMLQAVTQYAIRNTIYGLLSLIIITVVALIARPGTLQAAPPAQAPDTPPSVSGGRALWGENCLPCHGPTGQGDGPTAQTIENPLPNFADPQLARQRTPAENFETIKNGRIENLMPPWGNRLSDTQIWDLTARVWSLSTTPENLAAGEVIYGEQCAACHGDDGKGATSEIIDFTDPQVMVQRSQVDLLAAFLDSSDHADLNNLSEEKLWQTLDFVRAFSFVVPERNGTLKGQVINATTNQPQGDLQVTLRIFDGDTELESYRTQTDSAGNYSFSNLLTEHSMVYFIEGRYEGVSYISEPGVFIPDQNETILNLDVHDTTTSDEAISLSRIHYLIGFSPDGLQAVQLFLISNNSNQTYIGQNGQTFAFALPEAAIDVTFQNDFGSRFTQTAEGYVDSEPVLPGEDSSAIAAIYNIPYQGDTLSVDIPIPADVASFNLLMQERGVELSSNQLQFIETRQLDTDEYSVFGGGNLRQGETLTFELTGLDNLEFAVVPGNTQPGAVVAPPVGVDQNLLRWIAMGIGGIAIILASILYPYYRPRLAGVSGHDSVLHRQKLLLLLARLDDAFEAGELDEQVYHQARAKYKAQLVGTMEQQ